MKKIALLSFLISMALAGSAMACYFAEFNPAADCEGWTVTGRGAFYADPYADVIYTVRLMEGTTVVTEFSAVLRLYPDNPYFTLGNPWGMELCGDYVAVGEFEIRSPSDRSFRGFNIPFTCICDEPDGCTGTPGYWKGAPRPWPAPGLTVGGDYYTKAELLDIFDWPSRGDATVKLFHHTVAAMLNVLAGAGTSIQPTIDAANAFLTTHPLGNKPTGALKEEANAIKDALVAYNESRPCGDVYVPGMTAPALTTANPDDEKRSWGAIKVMYDK
jgi:hypothetical protein